MGQHICLGLILRKDLLLKYVNISFFRGKKVGGGRDKSCGRKKKPNEDKRKKKQTEVFVTNLNHRK